MATPQQEAPPNAFQPNNTLDASEPIDQRESIDEDDVGAPLLDEGTEGYVDPEGPSEHETSEIVGDVHAVEREARDGGWVNEAEWMESHGGSKRGWKPADKYVDFRRGVLPVVQKEAQQLRAKVAALEARERSREVEQRERASRIETAAVSAELKEAAEAGDWGRFNELNQKLVNSLVTKSTPQPAAQPSLSPEVQAEVSAFANSNSWLRTDRVASREFAREIKLILETKTYDDLPDAMEQAKDKVKRLYPERFRKAPTNAMGETGGESSRVNGGRNHAWANLKTEYRQQAERDIRAGKYTQKDYLANCDDEYFRT